MKIGRLQGHQCSSLQRWYQNLNMAFMLQAALADPERLWLVACLVVVSWIQETTATKTRAVNFALVTTYLDAYPSNNIRILYSVLLVSD